jgi:DNA (cytosine-5)-methyltransferase 1
VAGVIAIYNEIDPFAAQWLRNLIAAGQIAPGVVDDRSIKDLVPADVAGPGQRHFFAGIGVWSAALRDADVHDDESVWTGSCPCQPFSDAGRGAGFDDDRHLWPEWFRLIRECRPAVLFGEQVASRAGRSWLDVVLTDLEGAGYACAAADLPAAGVGAPHKRSRMFFVAYADGQPGRLHEARRQPRRTDAQVERSGEAQRVAHGSSARLEVIGQQQTRRQLKTAERGCSSRRLVDSGSTRSGRNAGAVPGPEAAGAEQWIGARHLVDLPLAAGATRGFWGDAEWIACRDGRARPVEPGAFPLVDGAIRGVVQNRTAKIKGYGNAIVRQVAAAFIRAALEAP